MDASDVARATCMTRVAGTPNSGSNSASTPTSSSPPPAATAVRSWRQPHAARRSAQSRPVPAASSRPAREAQRLTDTAHAALGEVRAGPVDAGRGVKKKAAQPRGTAQPGRVSTVSNNRYVKCIGETPIRGNPFNPIFCDTFFKSVFFFL